MGNVAEIASNEQLEHRRLLSFTPVGTPTVVIPSDRLAFDCDVAGDDNFLVATSGQPEQLRGARYDSSGNLDPSGTVTIATAPDTGIFFDAADENGNAVVAYDQAGAFTRVSFQRIAGGAASAAALDGRVLTVAGMSGAEDIRIAPIGGEIVVSRDATTKSFAAADVDMLIADGFAGDDTITNDTTLKATLRGGDGNDSIFGGSGEDRIHGGIGNDSLWGGDGADKIFGEDGRDSCYGNGGNDRLFGGAQPDFIRGNGGRDRLFGDGGHDSAYADSDDLLTSIESAL